MRFLPTTCTCLLLILIGKVIAASASASAHQSPGPLSLLPGFQNNPQVVSDASSSSSKTAPVPGLRIDDPIVARGKSRAMNACDKCSLCLARAGDKARRKTHASVYKQGTYAYPAQHQQQTAINKCLGKQFCKACQVKSVTYTLPPGMTLEGSEVHRILETTTFSSSSYLLNIDYRITRDSESRLVTLAVYIGEQGRNYTCVTSDFLAFARPWSGSYFPVADSTSVIDIRLEEMDDGCPTEEPCRACLVEPFCTRYTYAATGAKYPLADVAPVIPGLIVSTASPVDPTLCSPVAEFDLSRLSLYIGNVRDTKYEQGTFQGTVTIYYTDAA